MKGYFTRFSIKWKAPAVLCGFLLVVITALSWAAYLAVLQSEQKGAEGQLRKTAAQVVALLPAAVKSLESQVYAMSGDSVFSAVLRSSDEQSRALALSALQRYGQESERVVAAELWNLQGQRVLAHGSATAAVETMLVDLNMETLPDSGSVGPLRALDKSVICPVIAPVMADGRRAGAVVQWRRFNFRIPFTEFKYFLGNATGDVWLDDTRPVALPPAAVSQRAGIVRYERPGVGVCLAVTAPVSNTPWLLLVEMPYRIVLSGANGFLPGFIGIGVVLLTLGMIAAWRMSRQLTLPLAQLTVAAESMSAGNFDRRVPVEREDELGRLAEGFNQMADRIQATLRQLEENVTELRQAEEHLRERETSFRFLFARHPHPMWVYDQDSLRFLEVNDAALEKYGYAREAFLGMRITDIRPPEDVPMLLDDLQHERPALQHSGIWRHRLKNGHIIDVEITSHTQEFVGHRAVLVVARDVTARRQAERRLAAQYAVTRLLADTATIEEMAPRMIHTLLDNLGGAYGVMWRVDRSAKELRYLVGEQAPSSALSAFAEQNRSMTFAQDAGLPGRVWITRAPLWIPDIAADPDSSRTSMAADAGLHSAYGFPILTGNELFGVIEIFCREVREPDEELLHMMDAIGSQIGQFAERLQLEEQFRQAQKMEAMGRLAGGVAHDFNNLLTVIMGYSDIMLLNRSREDPEYEGLEEIKKAGESATGLTRQLLAFSRRQLIEPTVFHINDLVTEVEKMLRRVIGEDIRLVVRTADTPTPVRADRGQLEQVTMNLVVNARDASPQGGAIVIETQTVTLDEAYASMRQDMTPGEYVMLAVSDTGTGMTEEVKAHLFEPFFTTKEKGRGTGLGLATCYGIVKQSGGHIAVYSEVGVGTTMKVYLPVVREEITQEAVRKAEPPTGSETILLVEDEAAVRQVAARVLSGQGYNVIEAADGEAALQALDGYPETIHLLLTDVVLPGMGGRVLAEQVLNRRSGIRVLYASGYTDDVILQHQLVERNVTLLQKPFTAESLGRKVRQALDAE